MKKVLITGANSYVGTSVEKWLMKVPNRFYVETLDMKDPNWKNFDFSKFDVVFHVAGIAHVSAKKSMKDLYFKVNRDLAIEVANLAKSKKITHFIFMSSMIIFGSDNRIGNYKHVDVTKYQPVNAYGESKLQADLSIQKMSDEQFNVTIIRSPIVYGQHSKGNYKKLEKITLKLPIIPKIYNQRSMIHIDKLSLAIKNIIEKHLYGIVYPQDENYKSTFDLMVEIKDKAGQKIRKTKVINFVIYILSLFIPYINKVYGNKTFSQELTDKSMFEEEVVI